MENFYKILIHGGVGTILKKNMTPEKEKAYLGVLRDSVLAGEKILKARGSSLDAVEAAVVVMEDSELFNAGRGSVFTHDKTNEMDASIMDGKTHLAGAVSNVRSLKNPISVAKMVMEKSDHVMLSGEGAEKFAKEFGAVIESPAYFYTENRMNQLLRAKEFNEVILDHSGENKSHEASVENGGKKFGTVGAVAIDMHGNIAAATSTGGMTNKKYGRVGDSPIIGAGTFADNETCAVSGTGHGEQFMRNVVAYDVAALMKYKNLSVEEASELVINEKLAKQDAEGGLVAIDAKGNHVFAFNTPGMFRGIISSESEIYLDIYRD